MLFFNIDVHSEIFTPQEYPVEILEIAQQNDVVCCCLPPASKQFLAFMLFKEFYHRSKGIAVLIQDNEAVDSIEVKDDGITKGEVANRKNASRQWMNIPFQNLSNIPVHTVKESDEVPVSLFETQVTSAVLVCTLHTFMKIIATATTLGESETWRNKLSLIVIDNVQRALKDNAYKESLDQLLSFSRNSNDRGERIGPRLVFLTVSLLQYYRNESTGFWRMEETFRKLQSLTRSTVDSSSNITSLLRYSVPPYERIYPFKQELTSTVGKELETKILQIIETTICFINSHTYDPIAEFGAIGLSEPEILPGEQEGDENDRDEVDSLAEELKNIPDPKEEPVRVLNLLKDVLIEFGPWCMDRALMLLTAKVDECRVQTPYERHYLMFGIVCTCLNRLHVICQSAFAKLDSMHALKLYSTPKVLAVLEVLYRFDLNQPWEPRRKLIDTEKEDDEEYFDASKVCPKNGLKTNKKSKKPFKTNEKMKPRKPSKAKQKTECASTVEDDRTSEGACESHNGTTDAKRSVNFAKEADKEPDEESAQSHDVCPNKVSNVVQSTRNDKKSSRNRFPKRQKIATKIDENTFCGMIILEDRFCAKILYHFLQEAASNDPKLIGLQPVLALPLSNTVGADTDEEEREYKRREDSLRKFRYREANMLIGTSLLQEGIELPKANLVIRFDPPKSFRSYLFSKGRAQGFEAEFYLFSLFPSINSCLEQIASFKLVEEMLLQYSVIPRPLTVRFPSESEEVWTQMFPQFKDANLVNAISIVNRYCARLPSDTFTRLTPLWKVDITHAADDQDDEKNDSETETRFSCVVRLPINSPIKWTIRGVPMPTEVLAKRAVALQTIVVLHANGELDDTLMPVGKEGVTQEPDINIGIEVPEEEYGEFRPGSTKRRQYYDKQLAPELIDCLPSHQTSYNLYWIKMTLTCPIPEEQNTRGRKLHPPELAPQCFGIVIKNNLPPVPSFPIYTRCGEVEIQLVKVDINDGIIDELQFSKISSFHHYIFTAVLRLNKYLTLFDPDQAEYAHYVVPLKPIAHTVNGAIKEVTIDWDFLERIRSEGTTSKPDFIKEEERKEFKFNREIYEDAVVMPWYRSNDQPQYFYVAEICENLTPRSQFPGCEFKTFEEYYARKYSICIQDPKQPLLDVDHTSARLNFLTPRYVNRKGMALPTSSEQTKKAKRENLEQKQILVPELCSIHPFRASLWRQAVSLPCVLYRINCLLISNNIRITVARQISGLGSLNLKVDHKWESLSFGWTLSDVTSAATESKMNPEEKKELLVQDTQRPVTPKDHVEDSHTPPPEEESGPNPESDAELSGFAKAAKEEPGSGLTLGEALLLNDSLDGKSVNEILSEKMKTLKQPELVIGTWSNEMAASQAELESDIEFNEDDDEFFDPNVALPSNLTMISKNWTWGGKSRLFNHRVHRALYGSPTHWGEVWDEGAFVPAEDMDETDLLGGHDNDNESVASDMSGSTGSFLDEDNNLKVQFLNAHTAETLDKRKLDGSFDHQLEEELMLTEDMWWEDQNERMQITDKETDDAWNQELEQKKYEERLKKKVEEVRGLITDDIKKISSRAQEKVSESNPTSETSNPHYEALFNVMTPLKPPTTYPPSASMVNTAETSKKYETGLSFSFDQQPHLKNHAGPSPCLILQALTMSNANDGLNLERLETIGDSFLKYAITAYLFCTYENIHEGKLSHLRSKQVSNVHLYRLGRQRGLGSMMVSAKFEPHDNWLPPCYHIPKGLDKALIHSKLPHNQFSMAQVNALKGLSLPEIEDALRTNSVRADTEFIPYNLVTQQSIPDKSIADCVEALIGAYLTSTGPRGALLFMSWLGMRVLPSREVEKAEVAKLQQSLGDSDELFYMEVPGADKVIVFQDLQPPSSPLLRFSRDCEDQLNVLLKGYHEFETAIGYTFRDKSYLLQAFTHASYYANTLTDCYQRLEFLGDAILDYLITRHLYEDPRQHSPGSLTDLRSALVNNTIFASLAVKNNFHKFFRHSSPGLLEVLQKFVTFQEQHGHTLTQDYYLMDEEECEEAEDIEVPKALGDVFESVAGAIFLDSGMSLDAVWSVYYKIMKNEIEQFSQNVPKSPIRELLELEPETAKFGKPEKLWDGRRVRVSVEIIEVGTFRGIGRNYRIAKCTAAKCALRHLKKLGGRHRR